MLDTPQLTNQPSAAFWLADSPGQIAPIVKSDPQKELSLLDLLDKLLSKGVVGSGDLAISVAGVDLLYVGLRLMITTAEKAAEVGAIPYIGPSARPLLSSSVARPATPDSRIEYISNPAPSLPTSNLEMAPAQDEQPRLNLDGDPEKVEQGLAKLVLTIVELLRQLLERQATRRVEAGNLDDSDIERLGDTFMRLEEKMRQLKQVFGLQDQELNINLGPLGNLL